jgi:predicted permease
LHLFRVSEAVLGDLVEEWYERDHDTGWIWREVLSALLHRTKKGKRGWIRQPQERGIPMFSSVWSDVRYAARGLLHNPGFTAVAVLAIGLGIGVNTGIFSVFNGVALRPVPAADPYELVSIHQDFHGGPMRSARGARSMFSMREYLNYRDNNQTLSGLMAYAPLWTVTLGGEHPREMVGEFVSCNYFDVLRQPQVIGQGFSASNCENARADPVIVLSHDLWTRLFLSDASIIGRTIELNRHIFRVAGVAAPGFQGTEPVRSTFWAPLSTQPLVSSDGGLLTFDHLSWLVLVGRRKPAASIEQVRADLAVIASRIDHLDPGRVTSLSVLRASSLSDPQIRRAVVAGSTVILAGFGLVLLIACANVANLLLARAASRRKEIAVRLSVGASRGRLIRQLLTESLLIAMAGGALGSLFALLSFQTIATYVLGHLPAGIPPLAINAAPDLRVFLFAIILTFATGFFFGLAPATQSSRPDLHTSLKDDSAGSGRRSGGFLRSALVGVQIAVCMVLLIAAGLLLRGLYAAQTVDPGFQFRNLSVVSFDLPGQGYDDARAGAFQKQVLDRIGLLPGVSGVAQVSVPPLSAGSFGTIFTLPGDAQLHRTDYNPVSPEYFSVVGIPVVRGRTFTRTEMEGPPDAVIVTETTARRFWRGEDPIGKTITMAFARNERSNLTIIGVAKDAQVSRVGETGTVYMYVPAGPKDQQRAQVLVRSSVDFVSMLRAIRAAIHDLDPKLVANVNRLEDNLEFWRSIARLAAGLSGSLGGLALLLASIGVYGVVSYAVSRRIREVGIRMVLGAGAGEVVAMVLRETMRPVFVGAAIGILACTAVSRILSGVLFGISALDPIAFVVAAAFLLFIALVASLMPALRATRLDPLATLRYE